MKLVSSNTWQGQQIKKIAASAGFVLLGFATAFLANFFLQMAQNEWSFTLAYRFALQWHTEIFFLSTAVLFVVYVWVASLLGNKWIGAGVLALIAMALGIATDQKMMFRGEPLYPVDLVFATEIPFLIEMMGIPLSIFLGVFILSCFAGLGYLLYRQWKRESSLFSKRATIFWRVAGFLLSSLCLVYIARFNEPGNRLKAAYDPHAYWIPYSQDMNYYNNGFVGGFLYNLRTDAMEQPPTYSEETIEQLVEKYSQKAAQINAGTQASLKDVNVLFIMNESFSDPLRLEGFSSNDDPLPYYRQLQEETLSGLTLAQGYGGGTGNSEFEALTGLSIEPFSPNISSPYTQLAEQMNQFPSAAKRMKQYGHKATAIHPYNTTMYKRHDVYRSLGFDEFVYEETMQHNGRLDSNLYISDKEAYREILSVMESSEEKDFIHLVTMQNHMPYSGKYPDTEFRTRGSGNPSEADHYMQDLAYSDEALRFLVEELEKVEEHVIFVFWGDHLPSFFGDSLYERNGEVTMHQTPLVYYTNRGVMEGETGTISPIFLLNHILESFDMPRTPYDALLRELNDVLPAFEKGMYLERGAEEAKTSRQELQPETAALLEEYQLIQYDITQGSQYAEEAGFFEE